MSSSYCKTLQSRRIAFVVLAIAACGLFGAKSLTAQQMPDSVVDVVVEGNETIPTSVILNKVQTQPNRALSSRQIREDKRLLMNTRWFYSISERFEEGPDGAVLVFQVRERPIVRKVLFRGVTSKKRLKELVSWTGLKVGSPFDHVANKEAVHRIKQEYQEDGYFFVRVGLERGGESNDREVIFRIHEGPKVRVNQRHVEFVGNKESLANQISWMVQRKAQDGSYGVAPSASRLKTKLVTKESWFGVFGGLYKPDTLEQDVESLKQYYRGLGFFDINVEAKPLFSGDRSSVRIVYSVNEGVPYKVRNISLHGNNVIPTQKLRTEPELRKGGYFNSLALSKDIRSMMDQYGERGHYFASVVPVPKFTETPGIVDIEFQIDEDRPRYVRNVNGKLLGDHPHTMETVVLNNMQIEPGDLADPKFINRGKSRLAGSGLFEPNIQAEVVPVDPNEMRTVSQSRTVRGQNGVGYNSSWTDLLDPAKPVDPSMPTSIFGHSISGPVQTQPEPPSAPVVPEATAGVGRSFSFVPKPSTPSVISHQALSPAGIFYQPQKSMLVSRLPADDEEEPIIRAQSPGGYYDPIAPPERGSALYEGSPYNNQFQALPPGWVDINIAATEGRTGRLMFGAGVNSDAGIVGSFVWDERNFNLFNPPRTFADIIEGRAWRGGGQKFRLEAAPGDQVSRYALSWTDPFFMHSDYSLGVSGFYFNRFYPDWDETRLGGRVSLSRQLTPEWSIGGAIRLEDITVNSPRNITGLTTSVPELEAVRGSSFLSTFRGSLSHDTRDSAMIPSEGHFVDLAYEQAFGDFNYPRWEGEARQYFTLHNRPDGSGRHVLTLAGNLGWSGDDTPIYEKYFAGGFQSFRGFGFRGVTPRGADNISTGGTWQMLGTAEYRVPLTADDMINVVAFTDVGTVEQGVGVDNFRVTVGLGLRVIVPAMGPVPLAFDFGFPIKSEKFDDERVFSFYVGFNR